MIGVASNIYSRRKTKDMTIQFDVKQTDDNNIVFVTDAEGNDFIRAPLLNKGTAFTKKERDEFSLNGLIPLRILSRGDYINDEVFTEATYTLSDLTPDKLISKGTIYPSFKNIREISAHIALITTRQITKEQGATEYNIEDIKSRMWKPGYHTIVKIE